MYDVNLMFLVFRVNTHLLMVWDMKKRTGSIVMVMIEDFIQKFVMV